MFRGAAPCVSDALNLWVCNRRIAHSAVILHVTACHQVDDHDPAPRLRRPPLHAELQRMTGRACPACDAEGAAARPFPSIKELRTHVERVHKMRMCIVCAHVSPGSAAVSLLSHSTAIAQKSQ